MQPLMCRREGGREGERGGAEGGLRPCSSDVAATAEVLKRMGEGAVRCDAARGGCEH